MNKYDIEKKNIECTDVNDSKILYRYNLDIKKFSKETNNLGLNNNIIASGILIITKINNKYCLLLGRHTYNSFYGDFGGKRDKKDNSLFDTAFRELKEEIDLTIKINKNQINNKNSCDIIGLGNDKDIYYRMYFLYKNPSDINLDIFYNYIHNNKNKFIEIDYLTFVPIENIKPNRTFVKDIYGNNIKLHYRIYNFINYSKGISKITKFIK